MVLARQGRDPLDAVQQVMNAGTLASLQDYAAGLYIKDEVVDYIIRLISATRSHPAILRGASPRATLSVTAMAKSVAALQGRDFVTPDDVASVFSTTVAHRLLLTPESEAKGLSAEAILKEILDGAKAPKLG